VADLLRVSRAHFEQFLLRTRAAFDDQPALERLLGRL